MANFDNETLRATLIHALKMQDDFLNKFIGNAHDARVSERPTGDGELLKLTYQRLLEDVRDKIDFELGSLK